MPSELAIEPVGDQSSEQMAVGDLGSNDLTPQGALPKGMVTKEEAQRKYLARFGKSIEWEGRKLEVLEAGDRRLAGVTTAYEGGFYVIDPQFMAGMGLKDVPRYISEEEIVSPPSKRLVTMEQLLKNSPPFKGAENLPDFWTKPGAPIVGPPSDYVQKVGSISPNDIYLRDISTVKVDANVISGLKNNDVPAERLTVEEANRKGYVPTFGFPAQDQLVGIADFDQDGKRDLLLRNASTGEMQIWYMNGSNKIGEAPITGNFATPPGNWVIEGVGNFNNDNSPDIVWRNLGASGETAFWFMNNNVLASAAYATTSIPGSNISNIPPGWRIEGVADMDNDGKNDLIWRDYGGLAGFGSFIWYMNGTALTNTAQIASSVPLGADWKIAGVTDFNNDGVKDLFWHNTSTSQTAYWGMNSGYGSIGSPTFMPTVPTGWTAESVGDVNNNSIADVAWKAPDGSHWFWNLGPNGLVPSIVSGPRLHSNSESGSNSFNSNGFHSEFGYGIVNTSAAIAYLKNQAPPSEIVDSAGFNISLNSTRQNEILNLPETWGQGFTGQGVIVAVIDSGIALGHPAFSGQLWTNNADPIDNTNTDNDGNGLANDFWGWDFKDNDNDPSPDQYMAGNHGTQVAGVIAAKLVSGGDPVQGGAYGAKVMALRAGSSVLDPADGLYKGKIDLSAAASAITYAADKGAKVINLSFGTISPSASQITILNTSINYAIGKGAVVVIAAGNEGGITVDNVYPAILANTPGVIVVGSVNAGTKDVTTSANSASQVSLFSTGAGNTTRNYVMAPGQNIMTTTRAPSSNVQTSQQAHPSLVTWGVTQGTSLAAPLIAAAVANIKQAVPNATPAQIVNAITQTADASDIYL
jgi:subtilisin family serine protease